VAERKLITCSRRRQKYFFSYEKEAGKDKLSDTVWKAYDYCTILCYCSYEEHEKIEFYVWNRTL
jgi:hypothetical protein